MPRTALGNPQSNVSLLYNPYQQAFLDALDARTSKGRRAYHRYTLLAGRRGGKTQIGAIGLAKLATQPQTRWWACSPSYPELHDYVIPAVLQVLPQTWIKPNGWSERHQELQLINDTLIQFRPANDPERMRGPGLDGIWMDESRKIPRASWHTARPMLTERRGVAIFTSSPNGFDWTYKECYVPSQPGPLQRPGYFGVKYRTRDNPVIDPEEIAEAERTMDPRFFRQEYEADIISFEGAIYGDALDPCLLVTDDQVRRWAPEWPDLDPTRPCLVGLDPGADHPFAAVKLVLTPKGLLVCGEHRLRNAALVEHVRALQWMVRPSQDVRWAIDRSARQIGLELNQHGIYPSGVENNVIAGIQRVQAWLHAKQIGFVVATVPRLLEELRSYRWKDNAALSGELRKEEPFKMDDDLCDALRYAVMLWPELPDAPAVSGERRIEDVPEDARWAWSRERRLSRIAETGEETDWDTSLTPLGNFWETIG